ncbi:uncharacterized protein [Haliotis cracherodii]|uniref:uncharacterized protein n=1 Tax=Haliotis cracherodii TaxID=6455 RepID=UPI0039EA21AC
MQVPTLVTVLALPFLVMSRGEGGRDGTGMQCWTSRPHRRISVTPLYPSDCQAAIASAPSDQGESEGRQLSVTRDKHKHTLLKWKVNEKGDRVFAVSVVNESFNSSECYLVNTTSVKLGKKGKRKLIRCKYDRKVKDTKGRQLLLTVVPVNSSLGAIGGILSHKLSPRMSVPQLSTTPAPTGCFNWRPHNISGTVTGNGTITVTWFPAFRDGGLRVSLYHKDTEQVVRDKQILSYETVLDEITSHTFEGVENGNYEAWIKPTGCKDCPEWETEECHVNSVASDPIFASELTTPTPVGCYNWHPNTITLILVNRTLKVTWSPAFKKGSLEVYLYDKEENKPVASHTYKSYEIYDQDITKHTFQNVKFGRYEVRIKPTGCKDCPDVETQGCHVNPISSDPIRVFRPVEEPGFIYAVSPSSIEASIRDNSATFYFMIAVTILAVISAVAMAIMCIMKESMPCFTRKCHNVKQCKPSLPFNVVYTKLSKMETGRDGETLRIVILYGVDHDSHIKAVRAFAQLLRTLLNAEVVVEREQRRRDVVNIADWVTTNLEPPTVVIVVASEGLYQLFSHHSGQQGECISTLQSDMFADFSSKALGYLREKSFTTTRSQIVLPVSFGYEHGDDSLNKLMESCRLLFKGVYFKVTESTYEGQRLLYLDELLQCLNMNQTIHVPHNMPEAQAFLGYVDAMNDHIRIFGSTCWKYDPSIRYDEQTIYSRASSTGNHMNVGDTFSIGSDVSGTSKVTVTYTCRKCLASSLLTLPTSGICSVSDTGVRSSRQYTISESSCVSEPVSETRDEADVFYSESEIGPDTLDPIHDSRTVSSPSTETSFIEPVHLEQTDIVGRDC